MEHDRAELAAAAVSFQSEKEICQTSTETYSKVVVQNAKQLGKLHQTIEDLNDDIREKDQLVVCFRSDTCV